MASVCVNNVGVSQDFSTYACFNPRASFSREDGSVSEIQNQISRAKTDVISTDFEFRLEEDLTGMLPADELFSDGKLVTKQQKSTETVGIGGKCRRTEIAEGEMEISGSLSSPKAPRCSSRWRELLGFKRFSQNSKTATTTTFSTNPRSSTSSLKQFLHRSSRSSSSSSSDASLLSLPLLKDSDCESFSISSRMSLSSSSSGHDHEDIPRLSLDAERPNHNHILNHSVTANPFAPARSLNPNQPRMRLVKPRENNHSATGTGGGRVGRSPMRRSGGETSQSAIMNRGVSVDSPRLNSSGKIVFQSLERSSSSPSSFNGGTSGYRHRGMERSYSSNVRVTPVLNVPVCSIRGGSVVFSQFFSSSSSSSATSQHNRTENGSNNRTLSQHQHSGIISRGRNSTDRI